jgi:hAT family C-terminal dimerisation region
MNQFLKKADDNILYYVAVALDPRIKTSIFDAPMDKSNARLITSEVREFLKREYSLDPILPPNMERPSGMSETLWKTLRRLQPCPGPQASDIDRYLDSAPVSWSHISFADGDADWVLKWWKANAVDFPCMARAARDYLPIPSAEVGVGRLFSGARDVLGPYLGVAGGLSSKELFRFSMQKGCSDGRIQDASLCVVIGCVDHRAVNNMNNMNIHEYREYE